MDPWALCSLACLVDSSREWLGLQAWEYALLHLSQSTTTAVPRSTGRRDLRQVHTCSTAHYRLHEVPSKHCLCSATHRTRCLPGCYRRPPRSTSLNFRVQRSLLYARQPSYFCHFHSKTYEPNVFSPLTTHLGCFLPFYFCVICFLEYN